MKVIFDSNVYIRYLRDRTYAPVFERLCAELHSETYACGVVVAELYAGARDNLGRRAVGVLFRRLERAGPLPQRIRTGPRLERSLAVYAVDGLPRFLFLMTSLLLCAPEGSGLS